MEGMTPPVPSPPVLYLIQMFRGLYNLTCVDASYPLIEKVIRALIQLSSTSTGEYEQRSTGL